MSIINNQDAEFVNLATWNNIGKDHHWSPIAEPATGWKQGDYVWSHAGYAELNKYFITWWKTGTKPAIGNDTVFYFHRNQFKNAPDTGCTKGTSDTAEDKVYTTTMLTDRNADGGQRGQR